MTKGGSIAIGIKNMLREWGLELEIKVIYISTDSSAAKGTASRRGIGKIRHLDIDELWLQDHVQTGKIKVLKIDGTKNVADALTKHVDQTKIAYHLSHTNQTICPGRHAIMPELTTDQ